MWAEPSPGGQRYRWTIAPEQPPVTGGRVAVAADEGYWQVTAAPGGGALVVNQLFYDPGGSLPAFLVRATQVSSMVAFVGQLRAYAAR
jgi:hypothetical protein